MACGFSFNNILGGDTYNIYAKNQLIQSVKLDKRKNWEDLLQPGNQEVS